MDDDKKKSILVVDDMSENLRAIKAILEDEYVVRLAGSAALAKPLLNAFIVNLVLLDIEMPGENGFDFLYWLKHYPVTRHIPVIFLSSHSEPDTVRYASTLDIAGYFKKPVEPRAFKEKIHEILKKGR